jgi:EF-P beta-lysylation protein EpmB
MFFEKPSLWREIQRSNFTDWKELGYFLELDLSRACHVPHFPLNLPRRLANKIVKGSIDDPILRQFLPTVAETIQIEGFSTDPVGDLRSQKTPKLLHKYQGRALLLCTSACAMHCRYCFRQHFSYASSVKGFAEEIEAIRNDSSLSEIILSGGDPLSLTNRDLRTLLDALGTIPHVKRVRFHTRFPLGIPERIDPEFLEILNTSRPQIFFTIHSNHPQEWDDEIKASLKDIQKLGIPTLCQTVLLKGINDDLDTLQALCEILVDQGIIPYYLHQLDKVSGTLHFEVEEERGTELISALTERLSGYAVPKYVREVAGEKSKTAILHPIESLQAEYRQPLFENATSCLT